MARVTGKGSIIALERNEDGRPKRGCSRWQLRVPIGLDYGSKRYKTKTRRFSGTKTQARAALREFIAEIEGGIADARNVTFGEFAELWLEERTTAGNVRRGTLRNNANTVAQIRANAIGGIPLSDLTAAHISAYYISLRNGSSTSGRALTGTTTRKHHVTIKQILDSAVRRRVIPHNPCADLEADAIPKVDTREKRPLSDADVLRLVSSLYEGKPTAHTIAVLLAIECGLRREEVCGLTWRDVDLTTGAIHVTQAYSQDDLELMPTKSIAGNRLIPIAANVHLLARLEEWRGFQKAALSKLDVLQVDGTPVVTNSVGGFMQPENLGRWWNGYRRRNDLDGYGLHQLRHTYATILGRNGVDVKSIQTLIGDSTGTVALNVYMHYNPQSGAAAMAGVSDFLHGGERLVVADADKARRLAS